MDRDQGMCFGAWVTRAISISQGVIPVSGFTLSTSRIWLALTDRRSRLRCLTTATCGSWIHRVIPAAVWGLTVTHVQLCTSLTRARCRRSFYGNMHLDFFPFGEER